MDIAPPAPPKFSDKKAKTVKEDKVEKLEEKLDFSKDESLALEPKPVDKSKVNIKVKKEDKKEEKKENKSKVDVSSDGSVPIPMDDSISSDNSKDNSKENSEDKSNKKGFFKRIFSRGDSNSSSDTNKESDDVDDLDDLDLDKIRAQYKIPKPGNLDWTSADDENKPVQKPKEARWDVENPEHLSEPVSIKSNKLSKPSTPKKEKKSRKDVDFDKIPIKKSNAKPKKAKSTHKRRGPVNKAIDKYFTQVEREQRKIELELKRIVKDPKKSLKKKPNDYIIHHNEKLVRSMKQLLVTVQSIEKEKFNRAVSNNKRDFQNWVKKILDLEKKAEAQRNKLMQKKVIELFKTYTVGLNKDLIDKKYELSEEKNDAETRMAAAKVFETKLKEHKKKLETIKLELKKEKKAIKKTVDEKVKVALPGKTKKERTSLKRTETRLKKLIDEFKEKKESLKVREDELQSNIEESHDLISRAAPLKRLEKRLEKKEAKLQEDILALSVKDKELKERVKELEKHDKNLESREKKLEGQIKRREKKDEDLEAKKKELKIQIHDLELRKKEFNLREKEIKEMEHYVADERGDLLSLKTDVESEKEQVSHQFDSIHETENEIFAAEKRMIQESKESKQKLADYLFEDIEPPQQMSSQDVSDFHNKMSLCRQMIDNRQFDDAKKIYSETREQFLSADLHPQKKEEIHNALRELYDDIFLAMIR